MASQITIVNDHRESSSDISESSDETSVSNGEQDQASESRRRTSFSSSAVEVASNALSEEVNYHDLTELVFDRHIRVPSENGKPVFLRFFDDPKCGHKRSRVSCVFDPNLKGRTCPPCSGSGLVRSWLWRESYPHFLTVHGISREILDEFKLLSKATPKGSGRKRRRTGQTIHERKKNRTTHSKSKSSESLERIGRTRSQNSQVSRSIGKRKHRSSNDDDGLELSDDDASGDRFEEEALDPNDVDEVKQKLSEALKLLDQSEKEKATIKKKLRESQARINQLEEKLVESNRAHQKTLFSELENK